MTVLVLNIGSSSLKYAAFETASDRSVLVERIRDQVARPSSLADIGAVSADDLALVAEVIAGVEAETGTRLTLVGHRVVHGGRHFSAPAMIDTASLNAIEALAPLAPLHQPHNATGIRAVATLRPELRQVACFDTAFHRTQPELYRRLPLPEAFWSAGVERYGFHGLSYAWSVAELTRLRGSTPHRVLAFHLGSGASACAILDGRSHETTMGFSALDGLMMGTRPGGLDAGVILHLLAQGLSHADLTRLLYLESGLLGVSGEAGDMSRLLASGSPSAALAIDMFCHRAASAGAALCTGMGGLDAVVFTGGIGENASAVRAKIASELGLLGVRLDPESNRANHLRLSHDNAPVEAWIIHADEERMIAGAAVALANPDAAT